MFTVLSPTMVSSDEGFSVEVLLPIDLLYVEGARHIRVSSEIIGKPIGIAIYKDSIKAWAPTYDSDVIDEAKRQAIVDNISRALQCLKLRVQIIEDYS